MIFAYFQQVELAGKYEAANTKLCYAVEAAIKEDRSERVASAMATFRNNRPTFDLGTPPEYYRVIESLAEKMNPSTEPRR